MNIKLLRTPSLWGAAAPLVCAGHCVASPALVAFAPALAVGESVELALLALSAVLAVGLVALGVRVHGRAAVWLPVVAGCALVAVVHSGWTVLPESLLTAAGSVSIAAGMIWNARLRHAAACKGCGCPAHE